MLRSVIDVIIFRSIKYIISIRIFRLGRYNWLWWYGATTGKENTGWSFSLQILWICLARVGLDRGESDVSPCILIGVLGESAGVGSFKRSSSEALISTPSSSILLCCSSVFLSLFLSCIFDTH